MSRLFHKKIRNVSNNSLKEKTAKGLLWGGLGNGIMQILNLVFGIFLARLLTPSDYGMVGMLAIFSAMVQYRKADLPMLWQTNRTLLTMTTMPCSGSVR